MKEKEKKRAIARLGVIIPAKDEELLIAKTLRSIRAAGMELKDVYVLDDGSTDNTATIARSLGANVFSNPVNMGKAATVTRALAELPLFNLYTHLCFLDADTLVDGKYFQAVRDRLRDHPGVGVVCGKPKSIPRNALTAWRAFQYFITHAVFKEAQAKMNVIWVAPGCASTYSIGVLRKVIWSTDTRVEDMDVTVQAVLTGEKIVFAPKALVYTQDPWRFRDYVGQVGKRWYPGAWQVMRKHGLLWRGPFKAFNWECRLMFLEPFYYLGSLCFVTAFYPKHLLQLLLLSTAVALLMAIVAAWRERRWDIIIAFPIYPPLYLVDCILFLCSFRYIFFGREKKKQWFHPTRYVSDEVPKL